MASDQETERLALKIYDRLNPSYLTEVNVSKARCIRMAEEHLAQTKRVENRKLDRDEIVKRRRTIRAAFDVVRYDPREREIGSNFIAALGGKARITDTLLQSANEILSRAQEIVDQMNARAKALTS